MGMRTSEEAAAFLQEFYSNLQFPAAFDVKSFLSDLSTKQMTTSAELQAELSNINYGNGLNGGSVAGATVGTFLLGSIGTIIGGFLGQLLGGKSLGDVKKEVYGTYVNTITQTWDEVAEICDQDLSEERTTSFMNHLNKAVQQQLETMQEYRTSGNRNEGKYVKRTSVRPYPLAAFGSSASEGDGAYASMAHGTAG